jgi:7,8-dihydropterin-6-yl-methyl-4-(beta-D-ribofuranosyl)aminobenzene 5'-phosphate synthase
MISMKAVITNVSEKSSVKDRYIGLRLGHGQSFHISIGNQQIMFDMGLVGRILLNHMRKLNLNPDEIDKAVLSHGHMDHVGGIEKFIEARSKRSNFPVHCHPEAIIPKRAYYKGLVLWNAGFKKMNNEVKKKVDFIFNKQTIQIAPKLFTTGEISLEDRTGLTNLSRFFYHKIDGKWIHDPILDEQSLVLKTVNGLVILCGCCHPGLVNTCKKAQEIFDDEIHAIIGAIHLNLASKRRIIAVIEEMKQSIGIPKLYLNHSTGQRAIHTMKKLLGTDIVLDCVHSTQVIFDL